MRATDADRDAVSAIVAAAASDGRLTLDEMHERLELVFAARTHGDLAVITADLEHVAPRNAPQPLSPPQPFLGLSSRTTAVAVFSGLERKGAWSVPAHMQVVAIMGGAEIDLTSAVFEQQHSFINVIAIMGGIEITAPPNVRVQSNVMAIFGGATNRADDGDGQFTVTLTGAVVMGGVDVRRPTNGRGGSALPGPPPPPLLPR
ncbi:MAG: hypothetical protein JWM93_466 [Frankiales bacterium]|nr:hypothetical protein [Frankiales bacterium]